MYNDRDAQRSLMDADHVCGHLVEEGSFYDTVKKLAPKVIRDDDFREMYDDKKGRPSIPPSILATILLLQQYEDLSDRDAARRTKHDLAWKVALRVPWDWDGVDHSTISRFRTRLILKDLDGIVFKNLNQLAGELGLVDAENLHAMDSTNILGAAQVKGSFALIREAMGKVLEKLEEKEDQLAEKIGEESVNRYKEGEKAEIDWSNGEERKEQMQVLVSDACWLLRIIDREEFEGEAGEAGEAAKLLRTILDQNIRFPDDQDPEEFGEVVAEEVETSGGAETGPHREEEESTARETGEGDGDRFEKIRLVEIKQGVSRDRLVSVVDPEMRHGRKTSNNKFNGYRGHITEDVEAEWVTGVMVSKGNLHDGKVETGPLEATEKQAGYLPEELLADMGYGAIDNHVKYREEGVELITKVKSMTTTRDIFNKEEFDIDLEEEEVTCPSGETTTHWNRDRDPKGRSVKRFHFDAETCNACPLKSECTTSDSGRSIKLNYHEQMAQETREYQKSEEFKEKYPKRSICERKIREKAVNHGMRKSRYFGKEKTEMQMKLTAAVVNLKRLPKLVKEKMDRLSEQAGCVLVDFVEEYLPEFAPI